MSATTITVRAEEDDSDPVDRLAKSQRSKSFLVSEATRQFVEGKGWEIAETRAGLKEADAGDFASDRDVQRVLKKWKANAD